MSWEIRQGDCLEVMAAMPECSVDAVVCDPPYSLGFMGRAWDSHESVNAFQDWCRLWGAEALRVLKPGGHLLAFGGTRTYHRLACAIEDAGFEVRDTICWLYGSGFPKSLDVGKAIDKAAGAEREVLMRGAPVKRMIPGADQDRTGSWIKDNGREFVPTDTAPATHEAEQWDGWGTALKPAHEPIVVARKPLAGTVAGNVTAFGTGALNIGGCRVDGPGWQKQDGDSGAGYRADKFMGSMGRGEPTQQGGLRGSQSGRWPANVVLDEEAAAALDGQVGHQRSGVAVQRNRDGEVHNEVYGARRRPPAVDLGYGDSGGASRFFFTARRRTIEECEPALSAAKTSNPEGLPAASVPSRAATEEHHEDKPSSATPPPITNATLSESGPSGESDTPLTLSIENRCSPESGAEKPTLPRSPVSDAESSEPTGTTTTTPSPTMCDGSAEAATFKNTPSSTARGAKDSPLPIDSGGELRFRYCAKASRQERGEGNHHPTVKPVALMCWLVRLVTPPGGIVLDPFVGSGTTGIAALREGFGFVGIERDPDYCELARQRIRDDAPLMNTVSEVAA